MATKIAEEVLLEKVSKEQLMEFTKNISSEVRLSGSQEEWRAFQYAKETLEKAGLKTNLYTRKAFISLPISAVLKVDGVDYTSITHSMATSTQEEGLSGELLYVGAGSISDFQNVNAAGKIVLMDGLATPGAVKSAEQSGATGIVFISAEYTHEMIVSTIWGNPVPEKLAEYPKIPVVSVNYSDGLKIKEKIRVKGNVPVWLKTEVKTEWTDIPTLEAELKGPSDQFVLFSGHIDSWHLGAMDNGSANATMLEVARILSTEQVELKRSLRLVFWSGHSHGRYAGSTIYCDEHWEELYDNCVLHVNIDSVGAKDSVILTEGNCMAETKGLAHQVINRLTGEKYGGSRFGRAGDQSFWGPGVPSLFMGLSEQLPVTTPASEAFSRLFGGGKGGGFGWWWHTTEDTMDKIDPENLARDCSIYLAVIYHACTNELLPVDQVAAVEEIQGFLRQYQETAPEITALSVSLERIEQLKTKVKEIEEFIENNALSEDQITAVNDWKMKVSKGLVRLNYVGKDEFDHDPAMGQSPIPLLAPIQLLEASKEEEHKYYSLLTLIRRNVNKVNFIIREMIEKTEELDLI